jgi:hypothetical protein
VNEDDKLNHAAYMMESVGLSFVTWRLYVYRTQRLLCCGCAVPHMNFDLLSPDVESQRNTLLCMNRAAHSARCHPGCPPSVLPRAPRRTSLCVPPLCRRWADARTLFVSSTARTLFVSSTKSMLQCLTCCMYSHTHCIYYLLTYLPRQ